MGNDHPISFSTRWMAFRQWSRTSNENEKMKILKLRTSAPTSDAYSLNFSLWKHFYTILMTMAIVHRCRDIITMYLFHGIPYCFATLSHSFLHAHTSYQRPRFDCVQKLRIHVRIVSEMRPKKRTIEKRQTQTHEADP